VRLNRHYARLCEAEYIPKMTFRRRINRMHDGLVAAADRLGLLSGIRWILHHTIKRNHRDSRDRLVSRDAAKEQQT
ncbi:MAG: hypothetical protein J6Y13_05675, partial [Treponema sp.]|nr:hypothetical protein [Treponema sp.]